jgi:hypothetical protein
MKQLIAVALGFGISLLGIPAVGQAADKCPPELTQAKAALKSAQTAKAPQIAKGQAIQAPRSAYPGAKPQDVQAPRAQDIQSPRTQDIQAPRGQQEIPVPRGQEIQAPRVKQARGLVKESEAACKKGDMALSTRKATEALGLLGK